MTARARTGILRLRASSPAGRVLVAVLAAAAAVAGLWAGGLLELLADPERLEAAVAGAGLWAPLVFLLVALGAFPVFLLGPPVWISTALWAWPMALLYSFAAALVASLLTYAVAWKFGHAWVQARVPERIRRYEERLEARPFTTVLLLRFLLWANPLTDVFVAVSKVPLRTYLLATVLGLIPTTAFQVFLGAGGLALAGRMPAWGWLVLAALAAGGLCVGRWRRQLAEPRAR